MTIDNLINEAKNWRFNRYKIINLAIGLSAIFLLEFVARPFYRPYIYSHNIFDFHIADTLGNTLGTIGAIFMFLFVLTNDRTHGYSLIVLTTVSVVLYEIGHPFLGKPIDIFDIIATIVTGIICYFIFKWLYGKGNTIDHKKPGSN